MKVDFKIFCKKVKYALIWLWRRDALIFLLFVGLAFIFWWGRMMSSPRDTNIKVSIEYTGIPAEVLIDRELPNTLLIAARDDGKQLRQLSHNDLHVNINLAPFCLEKQGEVKLTADILRPRLQDILPGSTSIQQITPEEIRFNYHTQYSKIVPVKLQAHVKAADQYQLIGDAKLTPEAVHIYGSQEFIDSIQHILTDSIHIYDLRDSIVETINLTVPNHIRIQPSQVMATWHAEQFTEKSFTLPIQVLGKPKGERLRLFPQIANVTVRVGVSNFANIQAEDIQVVCHYPKEETQSMPLQVHTDNPHIYNIRISPSSVEYIIVR